MSLMFKVKSLFSHFWSEGLPVQCFEQPVYFVPVETKALPQMFLHKALLEMFL